MIYLDYLIPTLITITTCYIAIALYFYKKNKLTRLNLLDIDKAHTSIKKYITETKKKNISLQENIDTKSASTSHDSLTFLDPAPLQTFDRKDTFKTQSTLPVKNKQSQPVAILREVELGIKSIKRDFSIETILEQLKSNGYIQAAMIDEETIVAGVLVEKEDYSNLEVGHIISVEVENSALLVESYSFTIEDPSKETLELILKENTYLKISNFGINVINDINFISAQSYILFPKGSFHVNPLIENLDHLEMAQLSLEDILQNSKSKVMNISLQDFAEALIAEKEKIE